jgi:hypothetical protein
MKRPEKITIGEMRSSGVTGVLVYCADHHCGHVVAASAEDWPDDIRAVRYRGALRMFGLWSPRRRHLTRLAIQKVSEACVGGVFREDAHASQWHLSMEPQNVR